MKRLALALLFAATSYGSDFDEEVDKITRLNQWLSTLKNRQALLELKAMAEKPNYGGNSFAEIQKTLWMRVALGQSVLPDK